MPTTPPSINRPQGRRKGELLRAQAEPKPPKPPRQYEYTTVVTLAREKTPKIVERMMQVIETSKNDSAVVAACNILLSHGWGKPIAQPAATPDRPERHIQIAFIENKQILPPSPVTINAAKDDDDDEGFSDDE